MERVHIESSSLKSIGYDDENKILEVEFTRGAIYQYFNVEAKEVFHLLFAKSIGSYFSQNIAKKYEYKEIK